MHCKNKCSIVNWIGKKTKLREPLSAQLQYRHLSPNWFKLSFDWQSLLEWLLKFILSLLKNGLNDYNVDTVTMQFGVCQSSVDYRVLYLMRIENKSSNDLN